MNRPLEKSVGELAAIAGGRVRGDADVIVRGVASLESAEAGDVAFLEDLKLVEQARASRASCLIVPESTADAGEVAMNIFAARCVIEVARPKLAFALIAEALYPPERHAPSVHPTAEVASSAEIDASAFVGAYVEIGERVRVGAGVQVLTGTVIGDDATVGRDCVLHPNVVLYSGVTLGERVVLHAGVVVGADGFGYVRDGAGVYHKFPQVGTVLIEDDVEIGAHTCVDRGALGETRIGRGTKIDNLVQIAHNVQIGARVVIASQTGISGSTVVEDDAVIGGQVGMGDHSRVQSGAIIGSKAGILPGKIVRPGVWWGIPVQPLDEYKRLNAHVNRLPQMRDEIKELRRQLQELKEKMEGM
ncbi:MAG TPA: UDP-3-O-(3-hydroxymyristoyl)glucosamine N-acyltransferase [Pyrinomonadaceae bacterium]|jgi:UDP-3-O-[3-hydroxymyristoyl] glucosamine N-acyltransferase